VANEKWNKNALSRSSSRTKLRGLCQKVDRSEDWWTGGGVTILWSLEWTCGHVRWSTTIRL